MTKLNRKRFFSSAFTLSGTIIGAGILGLPYVFSQSGFLVGLFWLLFLGFIMTLVYLYLSEVVISTRGIHQLPGLAEKYLGKKGERIMLFAMAVEVYASLIAYLTGEGNSLSMLFFGDLSYSLVFTFVFWFFLTILLHGGIERLKKVETYGVIAIILIILGIFVFFAPDIRAENLTYVRVPNFFLPLGVTLFALLGFTSIPELREEMKGSEKRLKWAIVIGVCVPILLYIIFTISVIGVLGGEVSQIATLSFGKFMTVLGIFTMLTSYFCLSFSIRDACMYDLKYSPKKTFFWVSLFPLILFLVLYLFNLNNFITIIGLGGVISAGLVGILTLLMNYKAKKKRTRKPEYSIYINKLIIAIISIIFVCGVILEIYFR